MVTRSKPTGGMKPQHASVVEQTKEETGAQALARRLLEPHLRHAHTASAFAGKVLGDGIESPGIMDYVSHVESVTKKTESGDLALASRLLASHALTLDSMFTELARRAAVNMGEYLDASERYARLAMKAQSNCRATVEALAKLHQPREQIVKHVHVNEGGQAVVADHFHNQTGAQGNGETNKQSHAAASAEGGASLPGPDPLRNPMPSSGRKGSQKVSNARRDQSRRS